MRITSERFPCSANGKAAGQIYLFTFGANTGLLHAVAQRGTAALADWLIGVGADPMLRSGYDDATPLHVAARHDNTEVMAVLLDTGADIDARSGSTHNNTPLGGAIVAGAADATDLLLRREASVLDFFAGDAEAGVRGEFRCYSGSPAESWVTIRDLISRHA